MNSETITLKCAICLEELILKDIEQDRMKCKHKFHFHIECIKNINECPLCKIKMEYNNISNNFNNTETTIDTNDDACCSNTLIISDCNGEVKNCPRCGILIEKNGGCNNMTCRCGHHFNWVTLLPRYPVTNAVNEQFQIVKYIIVLKPILILVFGIILLKL